MTIAFVLIAILAVSALLTDLIAKTPFKRLDRQAESYVENTMARAVSTFAVVRGLNGMISVVQGTEVSVSPAGIGVNLSIGEVLDPMNDITERFSWIMLISTTSLGIQRVLMELGDWLGLQVLLTVAMALFAIAVWKPCWVKLNIQAAAWRLLILALMVRLFIPATALVSETIYNRFLTQHYREATQTLTRMNEELKQSRPLGQSEPDEPDAENTLGEIKRWMAETRDLIDIRTRIDRLGAKLEAFTTDTIRLMVVFLFQTIIIPLIVLWCLAKTILKRRHFPRISEP